MSATTREPMQRRRRRRKKQKLSSPVDISCLDRKDIWVNNILPFLGIGHYAFVGLVSKGMNQLYKEYCNAALKKDHQ